MSGAAVPSLPPSSVQATNALQGFRIHGGNNAFNFAHPPKSRSHPDDSNPDVYRNVHWNVPRRTNPLFTGRTEVLGRIKKVIQDDSNRDGVFVITGLGGMGKSEICLKIAHDMRSE
jgi:hypothetical protein